MTPARANTRLRLLFAILVATSLVLAARFVYWQIVRFELLSKLAATERERTSTLYARRGDIVTTDGFLLATDVYVYEIAAHPAEIPNPETVAAHLSPLLNIAQERLVELLKAQDSSTTMLTLHAPADVGPKLAELRAVNAIPGIEFSARPFRQYPGNSFAAPLIGFVNAERKGAYGVEQFYDGKLTGKDGTVEVTANAVGDDPLPFDLPKGEEAVNGTRLVLTINSAIQNVAERELQKAVVSNGAQSGSVLVVEPKTGAVRAMASYPTANLNDYARNSLAAYNNPAVSLPYEPGSVFKVVTAACALDYGIVNTNTTFNDTGFFTVGGRTITNHDYLKPGIVDLVQTLRLSLNVEAAKMAVMLGANKFYDCVRRFGFGNATNVDLAGEIAGTIKLPGDGRWYEADLGTNSFGQGLAATPLQMALALGVVANQGQWTPPYLVERMVLQDGTVVEHQPKATRQVIRPDTAALLTRILNQSIGAESLNKATIPGYKIAGKTGTSQIPIPGGYDPVATIASFGGFFPADDPQFVILIKVDRPKKSPWGSEVASPVFAAMAQQIAALVGLPPDAERATAKK